MPSAVRRVLGKLAVVAVSALAIAVGDEPSAKADEPPAPASPAEIVAYHDSGEWDSDITAVTDEAREAIADEVAVSAEGKPAAVFDIDDTSLSSYKCLKRVDFDRSAGRCAETGTLPAISQTRALYRYVRSEGVVVFFVTGRPERLREDTVANLRRARYRGSLRIMMRPNDQQANRRDGWKARTRRRIVRRGYRIVVNVGDQHSDLRGGYALHAFKLPNPMYVIPTA